MLLIVLIRPKPFALFTVKFDYFGKQEHHELIGWSHFVQFETDGALVWLLIRLRELLKTVLTVSGCTDWALKDVTSDWNQSAGLALVVLRLEAEFGLGIEVRFG